MMNIICFHNPNEENGYMSNWYPSAFTVDGVAFSSMEQYMMYRKAICFQDESVAAQILATDDVAEIKALGRKVSNYDESLWNGVRQIVVYEGLLAKFSQNEDLKAKLKATGDAILAECAVKDRIWGIGLSMKDSDRLDKTKWHGQNLLGYALMMVREHIYMKEFLEANGSEVENMLYTEWDWDKALAIHAEEAYEDGFESGVAQGEQRGMAQKQNELICKFSKRLSPEDIAETLQLSKEYVLSVLQEPDACT